MSWDDRMFSATNGTFDMKIETAKQNNCECIISIFMYGNCLIHVPRSISMLFTNLITLDISCNRLRTLPRHLFLLTTLEQLHANNNQLKYVHADIIRLENLKLLDLQSNPKLSIAHQSCTYGIKATQQQLSLIASHFTLIDHVIVCIIGIKKFGRSNVLVNVDKNIVLFITRMMRE